MTTPPLRSLLFYFLASSPPLILPGSDETHGNVVKYDQAETRCQIKRLVLG